MTQTIEQQVEKIYKQVVYGVSMTENNKSYYTEPYRKVGVHSNDVLLDAAFVNTTKINDPVVNGIYDSDGNNIVDSGNQPLVQYKEVLMTKVQGSENAFKVDDDFIISFNEYKNAYAPVFTDESTGNDIPFGLKGMFFDASAGVLFFFEGKPDGLISVTAKYWKYVGRILSDTVSDIAYPKTRRIPLVSNNADLIFDEQSIEFSHNENSNTILWKFKRGNFVIIPSEIEEIDDNTVRITFDPEIEDSENVVMTMVIFASTEIDINEVE